MESFTWSPLSGLFRELLQLFSSWIVFGTFCELVFYGKFSFLLYKSYSGFLFARTSVFGSTIQAGYSQGGTSSSTWA